MGPETGMERPDAGQGEQPQQALETLGLGEVGLFEVEAVGLQGGKQGLDGPALGILAQRLWGIAVAGDQQPLAVVQALGTQEQRLPPEPTHPAQHALLADGQVAERAQEGGLDPVTGAADAAVGFEPQAKGDLLRTQRRDPGHAQHGLRRPEGAAGDDDQRVEMKCRLPFADRPLRLTQASSQGLSRPDLW